ncbi:hypothetical protein KKB44_02880 [Candidatus Micrarchaeota archaeon]|nr:hypothetical protein [Candidatus Micrarchaeota archaeon]
MKKGFVITIATVALITLLVMLATALHNSYLNMERALLEPQPLMYAAFLSDSIANDVNSIVGPEISFVETNTSMIITIEDIIPKENVSGELSNYENFVDAMMTNAQLDLNFSNMSSTMIINEDYYYETEEEAMLFTSSPATDAIEYQINVSVFGTRTNYTGFAFNESGDLNVSLRYTDLSGTITESGAIFSNQLNRFEVYYGNESFVYIDVGDVGGGDGSLQITTQNAGASFRWNVMLPLPEEDNRIGYQYDATVDYVQDNIRLTRMIGKY